MSISDKRLKELQNIPDEAIDTSDIPELDDQFWEKAKMVKPITKKTISIPIDEDILSGDFRHNGLAQPQLVILDDYNSLSLGRVQ
ncbi:3-oxoacyl-ACP synthase [Crocosphaera sp. XPORK-15E]|uniref:3-oxoacyl-ACP synthase n=1 Tax=Crocosphaera sp. XPORK-15E TaxID=3110247 RepID=UPI002B21FAA4|nr:3-oxoacyl-ACP synthase [Crocosphaera sp. XPORK-15E]MEA5534481.1 3-oxoacyl-ACP synthase [Crocosphaera sp. XPORK-15E]